MNEWTIFGSGHLLGDIIDIIHLRSGHIARIVVNVDEPIQPRRLFLKERLQLLDYNPEIPIIHIDDFIPINGERYVIGFTGFKMQPFVDSLKMKFNITFNTLTHPTAFISPTTSVDEGCIINAGVVVGSHTTIGKHVILNRLAGIGHNSIIEDYSIIQPSSSVAGYVKIKYGAYIGMGANVLECLEVGRKSIVAAGAVVIKDIPDGQLWAGVPAQYKKDV